MILRELNLADEKAFYQMLDEWDDSSGFNLLFGLVSDLSFEKFLSLMNDLKLGKNLSASEVPTTSLYAFEDCAIVGKVSLRHCLNPHFEKTAGHIGFGVVDKYRGKGYGNEMLLLALPQAKQLGLSRVLLICAEDNHASMRIIQKNGGVLIGTSEKKMRFWIDI
jgi:predicted acetyltransferase